jgi:hypothetical protein
MQIALILLCNAMFNILLFTLQVSNQTSVTPLYYRPRPQYPDTSETSPVVGVVETREEDTSLKPVSFDISFLLSDNWSNLNPGETVTPSTTADYDDLTDIINDSATRPVPDAVSVIGTYWTLSPTCTGSLSEPVDPSVSPSFTGSPCTSPTGSLSQSPGSLSFVSTTSIGHSSESSGTQSFASLEVPGPSEYLDSQSSVSQTSSDVSIKKKRRINYSLEQLKILENVFEETPYPETERIEELGQDFNISDGKIRVSL